MDVDIRYLPTQDPGEILSQIRAIPDLEVLKCFTRAPAVVSRSNPYVRALREGIGRSIEGEALSIGRDGASDAISFLEAGIPAVEFGPVGAGHHGPEEWVSIASLRRFRQALTDFVALLPTWLERERHGRARPARGRGWLGVNAPQDNRPPREGLRFLARALGGVLAIVLLTAGATATATLLQIKEQIAPPKGAPPPVATREVTEAKPGKPQTIMILGSDRRFADIKKNNPLLKRSNPARSDTILLVRMDPDQEATAVLSIPRDLKVLIPGYGINKINAAYSLGGADLTAKTIKSLFGEDFKINHIINVNFGGFREVVNELGCIYADVDRRYYHSNLGLPVSAHYAEIDIDPGYQRLCGQRALDYVRFRHADSDIVRAARQQDFLRSAKDQLNSSALINDRSQLIKIMQRATQTDASLRSVKGVLKLAKLAIFSAGHPVAQIKFPPVYSGDAATGEYVEASQDTLLKLRNEFFHASPEVKKKSTVGQEADQEAAQGRQRQRARRQGPAEPGHAGGGGSRGADRREPSPGLPPVLPRAPDAQRALREHGQGRHDHRRDAARLHAARPRRAPAQGLPPRRLGEHPGRQLLRHPGHRLEDAAAAGRTRRRR